MRKKRKQNKQQICRQIITFLPSRARSIDVKYDKY